MLNRFQNYVTPLVRPRPVHISIPEATNFALPDQDLAKHVTDIFPRHRWIPRLHMEIKNTMPVADGIRVHGFGARDRTNV